MASPQQCLQPPEVVRAVSRALAAACCQLLPFSLSAAVSHPSRSSDSPAQPSPVPPQPSEDSETTISPRPSRGPAELTLMPAGGQKLFSKAQRSSPACWKLSPQPLCTTLRAQSCGHALQSPTLLCPGFGGGWWAAGPQAGPGAVGSSAAERSSQGGGSHGTGTTARGHGRAKIRPRKQALGRGHPPRSHTMRCQLADNTTICFQEY